MAAESIHQTTAPQILILNSYHKGYSWSDQILDGIESDVLLQFPEAEIRVEYMDTKRNSSGRYLAELSRVYDLKFSNEKFDLIFASDDNAIDYLMSVRSTLFPNVPIVFCGANRSHNDTQIKEHNLTGVLEYADIKQTVDLALQLQPKTQKIVIVNDKTTTGNSIGLEFDRFLHESGGRFEVTRLDDLPLDQLAAELHKLPSDTIVLLLAYLRDKNGIYYDPAQTAEVLTKASSVPVYSVWDFYFNHGVVGGVMTSGHLQGQAAAKLGLQILQGSSVESLPIEFEGGNRVVFDYSAMQRFNLPVDKLPQSAIVENIKYTSQKNVLVLNSYSADNAWTRAIMEGVEESFAESNLTVTTFVEYMDTKRYSSSAYMLMLAKTIAHKYAQTPLDAIVVSDDNAYNFILRHRSTLFEGVPVVFCGVNYLENTDSLQEQGITGVVESYDILGTMQLGLTLFPDTKNILVVNDDTTTGKANVQRLTDVLPQLPDYVRVDFIPKTSMQALQQRLSLLGDETLVLLMSFTKDKNNHRFSYRQSVAMVSEASSRPVLGFWDFYSGEGILGGVITSGFDQGHLAGDLAVALLDGQDIRSLPVMTKSPVRATLDYNVLLRFGLEDKDFSDKVEVLNQPISLFDQYPDLIYTIVVVIFILVLLVASQAGKIVFQSKRQKVLSERAETDSLTGTKNRSFLMQSLERNIEQGVADNQPLVVCYFDLDNLKQVNDDEGHKAGDTYITTVVKIVQRHIRSGDILCRVGGDEFVIVLPHCSKEKIDELWNYIYNEFQQKKQLGILSGNTGISYGFVELDPAKPLSAEVLIEKADSNMYKHKMAKKR
ncbi:diguanylate cyclase domain-containing protein [Desulforhopalus sp. 52FAK]